MAQRTKRVGLERSFQPIDPNTLTETMHGTESEDTPEQRVPVIPYEGYNFMPTAYGYRSYFGLSAAIEGDPMLNHDNTREMFCVQLADLSNLLVALADEGIYTRSGDISDSFVQQIPLVAPADEIVLEWSHCIIENILYVYRQGEAHVWTLDLGDLAANWVENTPTTLNMSGQLGIFKAGGRLGFWDSDNAVGYSSFENKFDVTPAIATGANITKFVDVIGSIINIQQHGDGFIIYATKSIVGAFKDVTNTFLWKATVISNKAGIAYRKQCVLAEPDSLHYAWTSIGLMKIDKFQQEIVGPEVYDFLKEPQLPIYLKFLEGRYLFIQLPDSTFVDGIVTFFTHTVEESSFTLSKVAETVDQLPDRLITVNFPSDQLSSDTFRAYDIFPDHAVVVEDKGSCANPRARCPNVDYGHYRDHFWYPSNPGVNLSALAGDLTSLNWSLYPMTINGRIYNVGATENPLLITQAPAVQNKGFGTAGILEADFHTDDNEQNFFSKSFALGEKYKTYLAAYLNELQTTRLPFQLGDTLINQAADSTAYQLPLTTKSAFDITFLTSVKKNPNTTPLNDPVNAHFAFAYLDNFWYEFGRSGELFYFLMRPREVHNISYLITNSTSNIRYPVTINLSNLAGGAPLTLAQLATDIEQYNIAVGPENAIPTLDAGTGNIVCPDRATLLNVLDNVLIADDELNHLTGSTWTLTASGAPTYKYVNLAGVQSSASLVGLSASYDQPSISAVGDKIRFHLNGASGEEFDIKLFSAGLESADNIRYQNLLTPLNPCSFYVHFNYSYPYEYLRYAANGSVSVSPNPVPPLTFAQIKAAIEANSACIIPGGPGAGNPPDAENASRLMGVGMTVEPDLILTEFEFTQEGYSFEYPGSELVFTFPGSSFLMQRGTAAPFDIVWKGAYAYDTAYKKWGKMKADYRQLLDFSPINSTAVGTIPYTQFGVKAALLDNSGFIKLFDMHPEDSVIKYGKIGLFRQGMTALEMIKADFRQNCTGQLELETSLDGRTVEVGLTKTRTYADVAQVVEGFNQSGKWHNLIFRGQFDLTYLEFVAWPHSRR